MEFQLAWEAIIASLRNGLGSGSLLGPGFGLEAGPDAKAMVSQTPTPPSAQVL